MGAHKPRPFQRGGKGTIASAEIGGDCNRLAGRCDGTASALEGVMGYGSARFGILACMASVLGCLGIGSAYGYTERTLHTFCSEPKCADGAQPGGEVVADQSGNLYGTTFAGGAHGFGGGGRGDGVVYEFTPGTGQYSVIYNFCSRGGCADGKAPYRVKLVIDTAGNLYGTTSFGGSNGSKSDKGGTVFELVRGGSGWKEKTLYTFCMKHGCADGYDPHNGLTYAGASSGAAYDGTSPLYGTTYSGGANGHGTVFALSPKKKGPWAHTVLYSFCQSANCVDGDGPETPLFIDGSGNIYGTTVTGGDAAYGVVFALSPGGSGYSESVLHSFCSFVACRDGANPYGGVIMDGSGNLFGTDTAQGGPGFGVLFELSLNGSIWSYGIRDSFSGLTGSDSTGPLILGSDGNLYGTSYLGGAQGDGGVFTFNGTIQSLYSFCSDRRCRDGTRPLAGLFQDSSGNFFGTTLYNGKYNGTLYELSP